MKRTYKRHNHRTTGTGKPSPTYYSWVCMKYRCNNPHSPDYPRYGGRGIKVCSEWGLFTNFLRDMGARPEGKTLDRIDVNGHYNKDNCKWSTGEDQSNNRRKTKKYSYNGRLLSLTQIAKKYGIVGVGTVRKRVLKYKWDINDALFSKPKNDTSKAVEARKNQRLLRRFSV